MRIPFKQARFIGLSIQSESIQLVELGKNNEIKSAASQTLRASTDVIENDQLNSENISATIKKLLATTKLSSSCVAIHVPHYLLKSDSIIVPINLKKAEIQNEIETRIQSTYPALKEAIHFDYIREQDVRKKQERIHFVLARKSYIEQLLAIVETAGLSVTIIDTENHALIRTWQYLLSTSPLAHSLHGLLSLSSKRVLLLLFKEKQLILTEEAEWHHDIKQLNQFLSLIANTRMQSPLHLLLTGDFSCINHVLTLNELFTHTRFHMLPIFTEANTHSISTLQQCELYIAFGLAQRQHTHARI